MGLDIYFHKVKHVRASKNEALKSVEEYNELNDKLAVARFHEFAEKAMAELTAANGNVADYERVYKSIFPTEMKKFTRYEFHYGKMCNEVKSIEEVADFFKSFERCYYAESDAYFRKVNFVYRYFSPKLVDECCFVSKADLEDLIKRCIEVLTDHSKAEELLPTTSGFFFGSTDYDDWYFKDVEDCKIQMGKLLEDFDEDTDVIFVIMSW